MPCHAPSAHAGGRVNVIDPIGLPLPNYHALPLAHPLAFAIADADDDDVASAPDAADTANANADANVAAANADDANGQCRWHHECRPQELPLAGNAAQHTQAVLRQRAAHSGKTTYTQQKISSCFPA